MGRNVLRIALYELRMSRDAAADVIVKQALELAKMFCSEASPKFANGVLATPVGGG
jgi:transcription antitermination protein NusB